MRHLLTDFRGTPIFGRHRGRQQQRRYRHPHLPPLFYLIENQQWHNVLKRCKTHPDEVCLQDDTNGNTPLHCACRLNPPPEVIKALLAASAIPNSEGATALHIAATNRCSAQSLSVLLSPNNNGVAERGSNNLAIGKTSSSDSTAASVSITSTTHPTAVLTRTGRAPIHYACMSFRGLQVDAFRLLLETTLKEGMIVMENNDDDDIDEFFDEFDDDYDDNDSGDLAGVGSKQQRDDDHQRQQNGKRRRDVHVNVMTLRDSTGQTPLGLLFRRYRERVRSVIQALEHLHKEHATANNPYRANLAAALRVQADLGELWEKARYMVARLTEERLQREGALLYEQEYYLGSPGDAMVAQEAAAWAAEQHTSTNSARWVEPNEETANTTTDSTETPTLRPFRIVHASVGLTGYGCPPEMIRLAISVHPHQVREMDEDGNLPLHIAAAASSFCMDTSMHQATNGMDAGASRSGPNNTNQLLDDAWENMSMVSDTTGLLSAAGLSSTSRAFDKVIKLLLQQYPDSAKIPHGKSGRLPLVLAFKRRTWEDGIKTLLYAYPAALHQPKVIPEIYMPRILSKIGLQAFLIQEKEANETLDLSITTAPETALTATSTASRAAPPPLSTHHHWGLYNFLTRHQLLQQQQQQQVNATRAATAVPSTTTRRPRVGAAAGRGGTASGTDRRGNVVATAATTSATASRSRKRTSPSPHTPRGLTILFELIKSKPDLITAALSRGALESPPTTPAKSKVCLQLEHLCQMERLYVGK